MKRISAITIILLLAAFLTAVVAHGSHVAPGADGVDELSFSTGLEPAPAAAASWGKPPFVPLVFPGNPDPAIAVELPVLMYHHIKEPSDADSDITRGLTVTPAAFETQMIYLQQQGYQSISMRQLFGALYNGEPLPARPVLLTFDDGYADNFENAAPILEKYGFGGTFNIITGMVGNPDYMNWDQVLALEDMGMEIGSHTATHPDLTTLDGAGLDQELAGSATVLNEKLGHPVYWLCYPTGAFDQSVVEHARAAGYLTGVTTEPGETIQGNQSLTIPRWRISPGTTLEQFAYLVE